jgi:hypothetical protein
MPEKIKEVDRLWDPEKKPAQPAGFFSGVCVEKREAVNIRIFISFG